MDWRPGNWKNKYVDCTCVFCQENNSREAGADAILEALRVVHSLEGIDRMIEVILKPTVSTLTEPLIEEKE